MTIDEKITILKQQEEKIVRERFWVDIKPYSHTIITLDLQAIDDLQIEGSRGEDIIIKYDLTSLGW
jgi:hypothetical protein